FVVLTMRWLRADVVATASATVLGFLLWWISGLHWYHTSAMVSFVCASYAALPYIAMAWRTATEPLSAGRVLGLGLAGAAGLFFHPLFPLPVLFVMPMLLLLLWHEVQWRQVAVVALVVPAIALLPNLLWMLPSLRYPGWSDSGMTPYQK